MSKGWTDDRQGVLEAAFSPERFQELGHRWVDMLAEHLRSVYAREGPVLDWQTPDAQIQSWSCDFRGGADPVDVVARYIAASTRLHHPRYMGHQVAATLPLAALCQVATGILNNGSIYVMGPAGLAMERALARWFTNQLSMGPAADVIFTSGGSLGNLTALLAARANKAAYAWDEGLHAGPPLAVLTSRVAHYSVDRAVRMLGWGAGGVVPVAVDDRLRMDVGDLDAALARARDAGRHPIAVVATAGGVPIGSFDPLDRIADFCASNGLWLHVDAAHGGAAVLSKRYRHLVAGIERADSVVWDAHKMLLMPSLVTAVVFRDAATSYRTFAQDASYLLQDWPPTWADSCTRTIECTKNAMAFKLYCALATFGTALLTEYVERVFDLGARLATLIEATGDFELALPPTCNIVMFRFRPAGASDLDAVQRRLLDRLRADGTFFVVDAELAGAQWLRAVVMSPLTTERDLTALLDHVRAAAAERV